MMMKIRIECRHLCFLCKHRKRCKEELKYESEQVEKWKVAYELARQENERLHKIIEDLTRDLDEAEEHAFCMQEKISTLMQKLPL